MRIGTTRRPWPIALQEIPGVFLLAVALASTSAAKQSGADAREIPDQQVQAAADEIGNALAEAQQVPGSFPAAMAVIVHGDATPLMFVHGNARADRPGAVDRSSQFYIASQTKSFIALLAAHLDEIGVLPLDTTLAQVWPQLVLPAPADPSRITMADLLSHQEPLTTSTLNFLTAYVRAVPAADYPDMLARYTESREAGFRYSNLGDLIYGAALETRTGESWKNWLQQEVLQPLKLDHVYSRSSQIPAQQWTWNHRWDGRAWIASPPKPDELMHAAGGLSASADDMAAWMRANLRRRSPTGTPSSASFERAQRTLTTADLSDGEIVCDGYSLGWYSCAYRNQQVMLHPGGYTGVVSVTVLLPAMDAGFSLAVNSDSAIEGLALELMKAFIGMASGLDGENERLRKAVADYPGRLASTVAGRREAVQEARKDAAWNGWTWSPSRAETERYVGAFQGDRLGRLDVVQGRDGLEVQLGAMRLTLVPASPGLFGISESPLDAPKAFRYSEDAESLRWNDDIFARVESMPHGAGATND